MSSAQKRPAWWNLWAWLVRAQDAFFETVSQTMTGVGGDSMVRNLGQEEERRYAHPIWNAIKEGDLDLVRLCVLRDAGCLALRGDVGETPVHWCFLYYGALQRRIAFWLLAAYPDLAGQVYEGELYQGESFLHQAVVHRDELMVARLIRLRPALLDTRATGVFFQPSGTYYGETPLTFAICLNYTGMVDFLLSHGADLAVVDSHGNSVFHLCVWHNLVEMHEHLLRLWNPKHGDPDKLLNKRRLSPLTLAAEKGNQESLEFLLDRKGTQQEYTLSSLGLAQYLYPLDELDYIDEAEGGPRPTALELLVDRGHAELLRLPSVHALLAHKWERWLHRVFKRELWMAVLSAACFTTAVVLDDADAPLPVTVAQGCGLVVIVGQVYKLWQAVWRVATLGPRRFLKSTSLLGNITSLTFAGSVAALLAMHTLEYDRSMEEPLLTVAGLACWLHLLFYLRAIRLTGPFIIMISEMLMRDLSRFFSIYCIFSVGFSTAFAILCGPPGPAGLLKRLELSIMMMVGSYNAIDDLCTVGPRATAAHVATVANALLVSVLLINLLIAMMGQTYERISSMADSQYLLQWARMMSSLQGEMNESEFVQYWDIHNGKRYIRQLEVVSADASESELFRSMVSQFKSCRNPHSRGVSPTLSPKQSRLDLSVLSKTCFLNASITRRFAPRTRRSNREVSVLFRDILGSESHGVAVTPTTRGPSAAVGMGGDPSGGSPGGPSSPGLSAGSPRGAPDGLPARPGTAETPKDSPRGKVVSFHNSSSLGHDSLTFARMTTLLDPDSVEWVPQCSPPRMLESARRDVETVRKMSSEAEGPRAPGRAGPPRPLAPCIAAAGPASSPPSPASTAASPTERCPSPPAHHSPVHRWPPAGRPRSPTSGSSPSAPASPPRVPPLPPLPSLPVASQPRVVVSPPKEAEAAIPGPQLGPATPPQVGAAAETAPLPAAVPPPPAPLPRPQPVHAAVPLLPPSSSFTAPGIPGYSTVGQYFPEALAVHCLTSSSGSLAWRTSPTTSPSFSPSPLSRPPQRSSSRASSASTASSAVAGSAVPVPKPRGPIHLSIKTLRTARRST